MKAKAYVPIWPSFMVEMMTLRQWACRVSHCKKKGGKHERVKNSKKTKKILSFEVQTRDSKHEIHVQSIKREIRV